MNSENVIIPVFCLLMFQTHTHAKIIAFLFLLLDLKLIKYIANISHSDSG